MSKKYKSLRVLLTLAIDLIVASAILLTFCYFHHVRVLWGDTENEILGIVSTTKRQTSSPDGDEGNSADDQGDFGASFPERFTDGDETVYLTDDSEIRQYARQNGIALQDHTDGKFIHFYRSHDVYVSLIEINTELYYEGTGKTYTVQYFVYDVYVRNIENIFTVSTGDKTPALDLIDMGSESSGGTVVATVNGDYMGNTNQCKVAIRNGNIYRKAVYIESDICVLYYDGTLRTYTPDTYVWDRILASSPYQIWNFGPALLDEQGRAITEYNENSYDDNVIDKRHPRTSFGYYEPGHYSFIVVDGRSEDSDGARVVQVAQLFEELGCTVAYNMDGGDSAQAYFMKDIIRIDEERFLQGQAQRRLYDVICIGEVNRND